MRKNNSTNANITPQVLTTILSFLLLFFS